MRDTKMQKTDFVREQIKNKPKNYKRFWMRLLGSAICGVIFALTACLVFLLMMPTLKEKWDAEQTEDNRIGAMTEETQTQVETQTQLPETTEAQVQQEPMTLDDYQRVQTELYAIGNQANKSIVTITSLVSDTDWFNNSYEREGQGSGTIIGDRGGNLLILTEKKVIKDASKINVTFINDAVAEAELMKYDGNTGLAVLKVSKADLDKATRSAVEIMEIGSSGTVRKGSVVIALGSPLGTNYSILTGSITATNNEISTQDNNYSVYTTDIVANKNGSGVLINTKGELVGVVMQSYGADAASTLTAVDVSELKPVMDLLFTNHDIPYLGVHISTVTEKIADQYAIPKGVYVKEVTMDSPAMNAGLQSGDVILKIAGEDVSTVGTLHRVLLDLTPGETYSVVYMREGTGGYEKRTCKFEVGVLK